jgi:hypothetical protein
MKQFQLLIAREAFSFIPAKPLRQRRVNVRAGDRFLVTSPAYMNESRPFCLIAREKGAHINDGWPFGHGQIVAWFEVA